MWYPMNYGWDYMMGYGAGFNFIFWLILAVILIALVRIFSGARLTHYGKKDDSALNLLRERYAKGEISKEEYEQKKRDISS